jgi:transporter, SSS family
MYILKYLFFLLTLALPFTGIAQHKNDWFGWQVKSNMCPGEALSSAITGVSNGVLIVAGGSNFEFNLNVPVKKFHQEIYVCLQPHADTLQWIQSTNLPFPIADASYVPYKNGIVFIGGSDGKKVHDWVGYIFWDPEQKAIQVSSLSTLPVARSGAAAAILGDQLFIAGGKDQEGNTLGDFWVANLSAVFSNLPNHQPWKQLPKWPGKPRVGASMIVQSDGEKNLLFLFGGKSECEYLKDGFRYDPSSKNAAWQPIAPMPRPAYWSSAIPYGQSHVIVMSGSDGHQADSAIALGEQYKMPNDILAYHTITNTWIRAGALPEGVAGAGIIQNGDQWMLIGGELRPRVRSKNILIGAARHQLVKSEFKFLDYSIVISYLVLLAAISYYFSRKKQTSEEYFRGGQKIPYWAVGISVMATQVSAIGFMSIPAKVYATDWTYFSGVWTWFLVVPIVTWAFIPFFRKLNVTSAYEYLERRFSKNVRLFSALIYCLYQIGRMGIVVYLPAVALSAVSPLDTVSCILIMGLLSTLYTVLGGIEAVIWIEVLQAVLLMGGAIVCIILAVTGIDGGAGKFWTTAFEDNKFSVGRLDWDFTSSSLMALLIGNIFIRLGNLTSDQAIVQRYMTTKSVEDAKRSLWVDVKVSVPWAIIVYFLGTALYTFYKSHPELLNPSLPADGILPAFIAHTAPSGLSGLIIAAIFAASMSTVESTIHSVATIFTVDLYRRKSETVSPDQTLRVARISTVVLGVLATFLAIALLYFDIKSILDLFTEMTGIFLGASSGLFMLGIFSKKAKSTGALTGAICSSAIIFWIQFYTSINFWFYSAIGMISCYVIGYMTSLFVYGSKNIDQLTIYSLRKK